MADITAADVKRLREATGAGMMDCKKALTESDGEYDKAVEILRVKGAKDVGKRAARTAGNGLVATSGTAMIELNCETDFVAKNAQFQELAAEIAGLAASGTASEPAALLEQKLTDGRQVSERIDEVAAVLGEKFVLSKVAVFDGQVTSYLHRRNPDLPAQVGVLVEYTGGDEAAARGAGMQVAAMRPRFVTRDEVPSDVVDNERRIAEATAREEGKPEQAMPKIVEGRVNGFFKDVVLTEQASVQDSKKTVKQVLEAAGVTVTRFARFEVGQA